MSRLELMPVSDSVQRVIKNQGIDCLVVSKPPGRYMTSDLDRCDYISGDILWHP